jgi:arginine utilization protein RocB
VFGYVGDKQPAKKAKAKRQVMAESVTFEPQNISDLTRFFEENKDKYHEIWVIITKKKTVNPQLVSFNQALSEAKKQGLIDSRTKTIDEKKYMIRFTKRNKS